MRRHRSGCRPGPRRACRPQAFTSLYRKYVDPVYRYCYRRVSDPDRAADLTASIFTRALESLPRLQVGDAGGTFRSWLFTIAHNAVVDSHQQHRITAELPLDRQDPSPGPEDRAVHRDEFDRLLAVLDRLPEQHRQIIELRLAGLTSAEIANVLSVSKAAVKSAQTRADARLRELLAAPDTEFPGGRS